MGENSNSGTPGGQPHTENSTGTSSEALALRSGPQPYRGSHAYVREYIQMLASDKEREFYAGRVALRYYSDYPWITMIPQKGEVLNPILEVTRKAILGEMVYPEPNPGFEPGALMVGTAIRDALDAYLGMNKPGLGPDSPFGDHLQCLHERLTYTAHYFVFWVARGEAMTRFEQRSAMRPGVVTNHQQSFEHSIRVMREAIEGLEG